MTIYERFLKYVSYPTTSDENNECCPSTAGQMVLAKELVKELLELGVADARVDEHGYVYGSIPASDIHKQSLNYSDLIQADGTYHGRSSRMFHRADRE